MTEGTRHRWLAGIAAACVAALAVACGNYHPNRIEFRFTPVPYTFRTAANGTTVNFYLNGNATCEASSADTVDVDVDVGGRERFERWLGDIGFSVRWKAPISESLYAYRVGVPLGSTLDAITLIKKQRGVRDTGISNVYRNDLLLTGSDLATQEAFYGCNAPR